MIDLHAHTTFSDGTFTPEELLREASANGLTALAVTDHDTFAGYNEAAMLPRPAGLELVCGIELTTKRGRSAVHLLGYFLNGSPSSQFLAQLHELHAQRKDRNLKLIRKLQDLGVAIELEEVEAVGRHMTGRPHFARVLVLKGYAGSYEEAFSRYLSEEGAAYIVREAPSTADGIRWVLDGGGIPSLAHPIRLRLSWEEDYIQELAGHGLKALEVFHSDHSPEDVARYQRIAERLGLAVSGGSDFHGSIKPKVKLGSQNVPVSVLSALREL